MRRYRFAWRGAYYCLDPAAQAFWPEARVVVPPNKDERLRLITTSIQFIEFVRSVGGNINADLSYADQCINAIEELKRLSYQSGTIAQVIALIEQHPESSLAERSIDVLLQWFIIERDIRLPSKNWSSPESDVGDGSEY